MKAGWILLLSGWLSVAAQEQSLAWAYSLGSNSYTGSSPVLSPDGETIYIGVEKRIGGHVLAIPRDGGKERWVRNLPDAVLSSPALSADGRTLYVGCEDGVLYALNTANGTEKWKFDAHAFVSSSPAIGADGTVYFGAGDGRLHALTDQGTQALERPGFPFTGPGGPIESSPAIAPDGTVYVGSDDGKLYAVRPDGTKKWDIQTGNDVFGSPAIGADGTVYVGSVDQRLYAIGPDGTRRWDFLTNGEIWASPSLGADGTVYIASYDTNLYALNPTGPDEQRLKWRTPLGAVTSSTGAVRGDGVIVICVDGSRVVAVRPDGLVAWQFVAGTDDLAESSPLIAPDGSIYAAFLDGVLYKLRGNGSSLSGFSSWPMFRRDVAHSGRALTVTGGGRLANLSTRGRVNGTGSIIGGFVVTGAGRHTYLVRGIGPSLAQFGVTGMPDPRLDVYAGTSLVGGNDDWEVREGGFGFGLADTTTAVAAFELPAGSKDAAIVELFTAGLYTAPVTSVDGQGGVALLEIYDVPAGNPAQLVNLSTRGPVGVGENSLIAGVVIGGPLPVRLLLRGVGPGLAPFGVVSPLAQPSITLFDSRNAVLRTNAGWTGAGFKYDLEAAARATGAFPLDAAGRDSAMIVTLAPGAYTIQLAGVGGTTGEGLIEIYVLP